MTEIGLHSLARHASEIDTFSAENKVFVNLFLG